VEAVLMALIQTLLVPKVLRATAVQEQTWLTELLELAVAVELEVQVLQFLQ